MGGDERAVSGSVIEGARGRERELRREVRYEGARVLMYEVDVDGAVAGGSGGAESSLQSG